MSGSEFQPFKLSMDSQHIHEHDLERLCRHTFRRTDQAVAELLIELHVAACQTCRNRLASIPQFSWDAPPAFVDCLS